MRGWDRGVCVRGGGGGFRVRLSVWGSERGGLRGPSPSTKQRNKVYEEAPEGDTEASKWLRLLRLSRAREAIGGLFPSHDNRQPALASAYALPMPSLCPACAPALALEQTHFSPCAVVVAFILALYFPSLSFFPSPYSALAPPLARTPASV